jgi:F-type H+-transporting ATPase subunit alpha
MKAVAKTIKGDISRYNEVKAFAQFGTSDLDQATRDLLNRGEKLLEVLKQGQYATLSLEEETVALAAIDHVLDLPTVDVRRFEGELLAYMRDRQSDLMATIRDTRELDDESKEQLKTAIETFKSTFRPSES